MIIINYLIFIIYQLQLIMNRLVILLLVATVAMAMFAAPTEGIITFMT